MSTIHYVLVNAIGAAARFCCFSIFSKNLIISWTISLKPFCVVFNIIYIYIAHMSQTSQELEIQGQLEPRLILLFSWVVLMQSQQASLFTVTEEVGVIYSATREKLLTMQRKSLPLSAYPSSSTAFLLCSQVIRNQRALLLVLISIKSDHKSLVQDLTLDFPFRHRLASQVN